MKLKNIGNQNTIIYYSEMESVINLIGIFISQYCYELWELCVQKCFYIGFKKFR